LKSSARRAAHTSVSINAAKCNVCDYSKYLFGLQKLGIRDSRFASNTLAQPGVLVYD
jgi:hypothetical protein